MCIDVEVTVINKEINNRIGHLMYMRHVITDEMEYAKDHSSSYVEVNNL
jgi:hypothetical protein